MHALRTRGCGIRRHVLAAAVLCLTLTGMGRPGAVLADDLADLRQRIRQGRAALDSLRRGESSVLQVLDEIDASLERGRRQLDTLNSRLQRRERDLERAQRAARSAAAALDNSRTAFARRVRALYKWQRAGTPFVLLNGGFSAAELMRRKRRLDTVLARDRNLVAGLSRRVRRSRELRRAVEARRRELTGERDAVAALRDELGEERARRHETLRSLRRERALRERALRELEQAARRLQDVITGSEQDRGPDRGGPVREGAPGFAAASGSLDPPVDGRIVSGFGVHRHPDLDVEVHRPGIDIAAPPGAEVRAVASGTVLYADGLSGYGKLLIIDHGQRYFTVYGHLSKLGKAVGDRVGRGERIAWIGDRASSGPARLYFEIRKEGKPVDPAPWFRRLAVRRR